MNALRSVSLVSKTGLAPRKPNRTVSSTVTRSNPLNVVHNTLKCVSFQAWTEISKCNDYSLNNFSFQRNQSTSKKHNKKFNPNFMSSNEVISFIEQICREQYPHQTAGQLAFTLFDAAKNMPIPVKKPLLLRTCDILRGIPEPRESNLDQLLVSSLISLATVNLASYSIDTANLDQSNEQDKFQLALFENSPRYLPYNSPITITRAKEITAPKKTQPQMMELQWRSAIKSLEEAIAIYDKSLEQKEILTKENHLDILKLMSSLYDRLQEPERQTLLGDRLFRMGKTEQNDLITSWAYTNYGLAKRAMKDYNEAVKIFKKALRIQNQSLGMQNMETARTNEFLGQTHRLMDKLGEAVKHFKAALNISKKVWEPISGEHPAIANLLESIGDIYKQQKNYPKAVQTKREQIDILERMDFNGMKKGFIETKKGELKALEELQSSEKLLIKSMKQRLALPTKL